MNQLTLTDNASSLIEKINDNLSVLGSVTQVADTRTAMQLVNTLKSELTDDLLSIDDNAETFIGKLNDDFNNFSQTSIQPFDNKYESEMSNTVNKVKAMQNVDFIMLLSTDLHYEQPQYASIEKNGTTYEVPLKNGRSSVYTDTFTPMMSNHQEFIKRAISNDINVDAIVNLGDFYDGHRVSYVVDGTTIMTAKDIVTEYIARMLAPYKELSLKYSIPLLFALGNHDDNLDQNEGWLPSSMGELYDIFMRNTVDPINKNTNTGGLDYYVDFETAKIRVVVLFCEESLTNSGGYYASHANNWTVPTASYNYLVSCVESLPNGYKVLILSHTHPYQSRGVNGGTNSIMNYVSEHDDKFIGYLCGHAHVDYGLGYPIPSYSLLCGKSDSKSKHTDSNDLWNVIAIDQTNQVINIIRFGGLISNTSGFDRIIHYNTINGVVGQTVTMIPTISNVTSWGINSTSWSVFTTANQRTADLSQTRYSASNYASISSSNSGQCVVSVNAQDSIYPQYVMVYAANESSFEFWVIKIPKQSNNS